MITPIDIFGKTHKPWLNLGKCFCNSDFTLFIDIGNWLSLRYAAYVATFDIGCDKCGKHFIRDISDKSLSNSMRSTWCFTLENIDRILFCFSLSSSFQCRKVFVVVFKLQGKSVLL